MLCACKRELRGIRYRIIKTTLIPKPEFLYVVASLFILQSRALAAAPLNDHFDSRISLGTGFHILAGGSNIEATKEPGEPVIEGNPGGRSLWWSWTAPQNGTVTIKTEGSHFDTLLGIYTGTSITNLIEVASGDDSLGLDPLSSIVIFHVEQADVFQIAVDGYRGDFGEIASGTVVLAVDFVLDRYTLAVGSSSTD